MIDRGRQAGRGYYRDLCFKVYIYAGGEPQEVGDGGFTDWTARLAANRKERLLISGVGIDRLAAFGASAQDGESGVAGGLSRLSLVKNEFLLSG